MSSPRIASEDAICGQDKTFDRTVLIQRLDGIVRACRCEATRCAQMRREHKLIQLDTTLQQVTRNIPDPGKHARSTPNNQPPTEAADRALAVPGRDAAKVIDNCDAGR